MRDAPEDDDDGRLGVADETQTFPDHEARGDDGREVEHLEQHLHNLFISPYYP